MRSIITGILISFTVLAFTALSTAQESTPTPSPEVTEAAPTPAPRPSIDIWLPDVLLANGDASEDAFYAQVDAFESATGYEVNIRLKRVGDAGGVMSTLRTASDVAPGVLPDLTLLRRHDMVTAQRTNLIQPVEGMVSSTIQGNLNSALTLGQVGGELYGVPYVLDMMQVLHHSDEPVPVAWSFEDLLASDRTFAFPGGRVSGISDTFLAQYIASGGELAPDGALTLNTDALRRVLEFYEAASDQGNISALVMNYATANDYDANFRTGSIDSAVYPTTLYVPLMEDESDVYMSSVPTETGVPTTVINGWMWVLVTNEPEKFTMISDFFAWMFDPQRQAAYTATTRFLPSQRTALADGVAEGLNTDAITAMLDNAVVTISEGDGGTLARAMQDALQSVLTKEKTAEEAVTTVVSQQGNTSP